MKILRLFVTAALMFSALVFSFQCGTRPPNVILVMVDTLRSDFLSCNGASEVSTPAIDSIAREGFVFANVHAAAPTTLASTSSLMTSLYPRMHGALRNDMTVNEALLTLAEVLQERGYNTAAFISSYALHSSTGLLQGFSLVDEEFTGALGGYVLQRRAESVNDAVLKWLDRSPREPFFLFVHYFDPHAPYTPPGPFAGSKVTGAGAQVTGSMADVKVLKSYLRDGSEVDGRVERMRELYGGEVRYTDHEFGRLLETLRGKSLLDNSLLVFTADHGETFWEHREMGEFFDHGYMVYGTTTFIPLIMRWPGKIPAGSSHVLASNIDIAPTILDLVGYEVPVDFSGRSLEAVIEGRKITDVPVFSEATKPYGKIEYGAAIKNDFKPKCVVMDGKKFIWMPFWDNLEEMYDLENDPNETLNLLDEKKLIPEAEDLRELLRQWSREGSGIARNSRSRLDEDTIRKLEALGYMQRDE